MITLKHFTRGGKVHWNATYDNTHGHARIGFEHDTAADSMRYALIKVRQQGYEKQNVNSFEDWTAIAAVLGANEANRIFGEIQRGEPWTVFPPDRMKNNSVLSIDSKAV